MGDLTLLEVLVIAFAVGGAGANDAVAEAHQTIAMLDRRVERRASKLPIGSGAVQWARK